MNSPGGVALFIRARLVIGVSAPPADLCRLGLYTPDMWRRHSGHVKMKSRLSRIVGPIAMAVTVAIALVLLEHELKAYHYRDLMRQAWTLPHSHLPLALLLTAVAYAVLPRYDAITLAYVEHPLPVRRIAFGSFIAYALSHSLGFPLLSGGPVRYRFWSVWGLFTSEIAQSLRFAGATFTIGLI